jgi:hypothetical protein
MSEKDEVINNQGPKGYCDDNPSIAHRVIITHTDGKFNQEKSCKNWRLNNRSM